MVAVENNPKYLDDFIKLNEEWITAYFKIEDSDRRLSKNPEKIIEDGGFIFSLLLDEEIVGVCALFYEREGVYELARMAVSPKHQGKGYGEKLMQLCLAKLDTVDAKKVYLLSNTKLHAAISLYKKYGFQTTSQRQHPVYSRANIVMERTIT